jgi:Concanavalin A-like lectin/glucanases superfamily
MAFFRGPNVVTDGLVLALDAANPKSYVSGSTIWNDLSGNGNSGTLISGSTFNSDNRGSLVFNGTNQYVSFSTYQQPAQSSTSSFTWNIWIFYNGGGYNPIIGNRFGGATWNKYTGFGLEYAATQNVLVGGPTSNAWCNISIVKNNTSFTLYRNSTSISTTTNTNSTVALPFYIGGDPGGEFSNCYISNVQVYDRALSYQEILQNYNALKSRFNLN